MTIIFDGNALAEKKRQKLALKITKARENGRLLSPIKIAAIVFEEDEGGRLYTRKKAIAAQEVGMEYEPYFFGIGENIGEIKSKIFELNNDEKINGIIIQKPMRRVYENVANIQGLNMSFNDWWTSLTASLIKEKDIDGLSPETLQSIKKGIWRAEKRVLPATVKAVLEVLMTIKASSDKGKMVIIGKSDLLGLPLFEEVLRQGFEVELIGRKELKSKIDNGNALREFKYIISATGQSNLINSSHIVQGTVLIDVGEPNGDIDLKSVLERADFVTPVPGGIGPLTVISLLENAYQLKENI